METAFDLTGFYFRINLTCQCIYFSELLTDCVTRCKLALNQLYACSGHTDFVSLFVSLQKLLGSAGLPVPLSHTVILSL